MCAEALSIRDLALRLGISTQAVRKRQGLEQFMVNIVTKGSGNRCLMVRPEALQLWGVDPISPPRSRRSDKGKPRKCTDEQWAAISMAVRGFYLVNAQANLKLACEEVVRQAEALPLTATQIYKRLTRKTSEFYSDNWELIRRSALRKKDISLALPTDRYDWLSIFESLGWAGQGFGALRGWTIDVRKNDVWTLDETTGSGEMAQAIYIRCALTGFMLWVEPIPTETSEAIIRSFLKCMIAWRRVPDLFIAIDNGRSMIAERTLGVLASALPQEAFERATEFPEVFGQMGSPILRNLPNIPRAPFKAALERSFKLIKDEFDAPRHPLQYQGGSRAEAVQTTVANRPPWHFNKASLVAASAYYQDLERFLHAEYLTRPRPRMFPLLVERGMTPSIDCAFTYYYTPGAENLPHGDRLALLLYFATEKRPIVHACLGYVDCTINGQFWHCVSPRLDHRMVGRRIAVLPIPGSDQAILVLCDDPSHPTYLDTVPNAFVRSAERLAEIRSQVMSAQDEIRAKLRAARASTPDMAWGRDATVIGARELPHDARAWIDGEEIEIEDISPTHAVDDAESDLDGVIDS